jgi:hypothetical protein
MKNGLHRWSSLSLAAVVLALVAPFGSAAPVAKASWSSAQVELEATRGGYAEREVQFTVTRDMGLATLEAVPALRNIVSLEPAQFDHLEAGQTYSTRLLVESPVDGREGVHAGTIHLRAGSATISATLKVMIHVHGEAPDSYVPEGVVTLEGANESAFNATSSVLSFVLSGAIYSNNLAEIQLYHQGQPVPGNMLAVAPNSINVEPILTPGRNELLLVANDAEGNFIYEEYVLWAGNHTLQGHVVDQHGQLLDNANISIKLGDDAKVRATVESSGGQFSVFNLPPRTVILEATADGGYAGSVAANGSQGFVSLSMLGFYPPSDIDNNDFSQGWAGWEVGDATVWLRPHVPDLYSETMLLSQASALSIASEVKSPDDRQSTHDLLTHGLSRSVSASSGSGGIGAQYVRNMDLVLITDGEDPQTISRAFDTTPGVTQVRVRYRFITTEILGGYFGTRFNDYFNVSIRNASGDRVVESNSMNGLGLGAFDIDGWTAWREQTLSVDPQGETVQVDVTVSNVVDHSYNSGVIIDLIEEQNLAVTSLQLNDIDEGTLQFLSASPHTYFAGNTRIFGTITVEGASDDALSSLELEVIQGGTIVATAALDSGAQSALLQPFGDDGTVEVSSPQLLFNLVPSGINSVSNGTVSLRVRAQSQAGEETTKDVGAVQVLRQVDNVMRFGDRDAHEGGDDWAKPSVADFVEQYAGLIWNDFSNMNGGIFEPHKSHHTGNDADGWFHRYNAIDAATAATMVAHLNEPLGSRITTVFVTYEAKPGNAFYDAIQGVTLNDGRAATEVIRPVIDHTTHFHWRIAD